ncbi:MAG: septum formation initiator family protein [Clostridia bacterium]|nr:septum formation initiator family protein [Clostridia bacterium]
MTEKKPVRANLIIRVAFILIFIFLFVSVINLQVQMNDLRTQRDALVKEVQNRQDAIDELELRIATPVDDEFIERIARERGYRKPNEIIFKNNIAG